MKYKIIHVPTGKDAGDDSLFVFPDGTIGMLQWGTVTEVEQSDYAVVLLEYTFPVLPLEDYEQQEAFDSAAASTKTK